MRCYILILAKFLCIAFFAGLAAWAIGASIFVFERSPTPVDLTPILTSIFWVALLGSYVVGLPVAALVFAMAHKHLVQSPKTLFMLAALAGVMMTLTCLVLGDARAAMLFGIPSFAAAMTFAAFGYLWIIKPQREALNV